MSLFDKSKIILNKAQVAETKRVVAFDLARFFAIILMIQGHTLDALASPVELDINNLPWSIWHFIRRFTAPLFLIVSGASQVFANKRDANGFILKKTIRKRINYALILIFIGYILLLPAQKIWDLFFVEHKYWISFFQVNILQLIGVSLLMILAAFMVTRTNKSLGILSLSIALIITFLTPLIHKISWFNYLPECFASYFSFEHGSIFPVFPYTAYMFYGVAFGAALKNIPLENRNNYILKRAFPVGIISFFIGGIFIYLFKDMNFSPELMLRVDPGKIILDVGVVLLCVTLTAFIYSKTKSLAPFYTLFGKQALFIYILHLIILFGTPWFSSIAQTYYKSLNITTSLQIAVGVEIITITCAYFLDYAFKTFPQAKYYYRFTLTAVLLYFLFLASIFAK
jgi:uncharacterized membrane protein